MAKFHVVRVADGGIFESLQEVGNVAAGRAFIQTLTGLVNTVYGILRVQEFWRVGTTLTKL